VKRARRSACSGDGSGEENGGQAGEGKAYRREDAGECKEQQPALAGLGAGHYHHACSYY